MNSRILVTSALPYVTGTKHIGNLAGSLIPADVHARFQRLKGREVLFVCGTDEHGTPAELAAGASGIPVAEHCALQHAEQAATYRGFDISFDHFGRTSSPANHELTREIYLALDAAGFIEERVTPQAWSATDGRFLPDRYVTGTCPHCGHPEARGDQCDACGRLLDAADLISPRSAVSGAGDVELVPTKHLFLKQSLAAAKLEEWLLGKVGEWEPLVTSLALGRLAGGLEDRCITRDLSWGVPVPREGYGKKSFYVWFDAPIAYVSLVKEWADSGIGRDWRDWWSPEADVSYTQFMGKDNVEFHTLTFPSSVVGSGHPIRLVDRIKAFNWLTFPGGKFSTSSRRGVFADEALEEFPADTWRWWLTANAPETSDTLFSSRRFADGVNADLANGFGNFANRTLRFADAKFGGLVPGAGVPGPGEDRLARDAAELVAGIAREFEALRLRRACALVRELWSLGDRYVSEESPWALVKSDPERAACVTRTALNLLALGAVVASPVIPGVAGTILDSLSWPGTREWPADPAAWLAEPGGRPLAVPAPAFPRIDDARVAALEARYGG